MSDPTPDPVRSTVSSIVEAVKELLPPLALSAALVAMMWVAIPQENHDPVNIIIGGFLGYLTGRATSRKPSDGGQ